MVRDPFQVMHLFCCVCFSLWAFSVVRSKPVLAEPHQFILLSFSSLKTLTPDEASSAADIPPDHQTDFIPGSPETRKDTEPQTYSDPHSEGQDHDRAAQALQSPTPSTSSTLVTPDQLPPPAQDQATTDNTPPRALLPEPTEGSGDAPAPQPTLEAVPSADPSGEQSPRDIQDAPTSGSVGSLHTG